MYKYELDQVVWYLTNNRIHAAPVLSRMIVQNLRNEAWCSTSEQENLYMYFGQDTVQYRTTHGVFTEDKVFGSKDQLKESL